MWIRIIGENLVIFILDKGKLERTSSAYDEKNQISNCNKTEVFLRNKNILRSVFCPLFDNVSRIMWIRSLERT
jgi:hypothetical protein